MESLTFAPSFWVNFFYHFLPRRFFIEITSTRPAANPPICANQAIPLPEIFPYPAVALKI